MNILYARNLFSSFHLSQYENDCPCHLGVAVNSAVKPTEHLSQTECSACQYVETRQLQVESTLEINNALHMSTKLALEINTISREFFLDLLYFFSNLCRISLFEKVINWEMSN